MQDYKKMYAVLCIAVDSVIDPLEKIPKALPYAAVLRRALLAAENIYIDSSATSQNQTIIKISASERKS